MQRSFRASLFLLLSVLCAVPGRSQATASLAQLGWYADPEIHIFAGQYWIYLTGHHRDRNEQQTFNPLQQKLRAGHLIHHGYLHGTSMDALSSPNLVHWTIHPDVLEVKNSPWVAYALWAPSAIHWKGKYYLFFAANDIQEHDTFPGGIGVAVSDRPDGPFIDPLGKPLLGEYHNGAQPIDPMVFRDDGKIYLYYGGHGHCNVARLSSDLKRVFLMRDGEIYKEITPEHYVEAPYVIKRKGVYYLMWSEGDWENSSYDVAYARSSTPTGPFKRSGTILATDPAIANGPGSNSVLHIPRTDDGSSSTTGIRWAQPARVSACWPSTA